MTASMQTNARNVAQDYITTATMTCDNNYQPGGYAVTPQSFGDSVSIDDIVPIAQSASYVAEYVAATSSIRIMQDTGSGLVEVPANTDLHTLTVQLLIFGR